MAQGIDCPWCKEKAEWMGTLKDKAWVCKKCKKVIEESDLTMKVSIDDIELEIPKRA